MNSIKITSTNQAFQNILDEFEDFESRLSGNPPTKKVITFKQDPIACACASYRVWKETPARRWEDIDNVVVWQDDIEQAQALRTYYRERLVMSALKNVNGKVSEFRRKLGALVTDQLEITKEEIGMLYRLPYFYAEDLDIDYVVENTANSKAISPVLTDSQPMVMSFQPLRKILRSRRSGEINQYWWTTGTGGIPFAFSIRTDNPLMGMIDSLFEREQVALKHRVRPSSFRGYHADRWHYQLYDLRLP
jgi:hypothetical protein